MKAKNKAVVGLYRHDHKANNGAGASQLVETLELDTDMDALLRKRGWKNGVIQQILERGYSVLSLSVAHDGADLNVTIVASVERKPPQFGSPRKVSMVGRRAVSDGPVKTGKTMAAKRRSR